MSRLFNTRWLAWAQVMGILAGAVILYLWPAQSAWALLVALLPWAFSLALGLFDYRPTRFDLPLLVFLLTALGGVWAAYDRSTAWTKFWLIGLAVLLYYALANQPKANLWQVAGLLSGLGGLIALYFLLTHDWQTQPADLEFINRLGRRWMAIRPMVSWPGLHPNAVGGMLALLIGFALGLGVWAWRERRGTALAWAVGLGGLMGLGWLFTSSRAAWLAWLAAAGLALLWTVGRSMAERFGLSRHWGLGLIGLLGVGMLVGVLALSPDTWLRWVDQLPGAASGVSRLELFSNTLALTGDFSLTGGGLGSFPGLYSQYMMVLPVFLFGYSHNLFLDVWLEQGVLGGVAFVVIWLGSVAALLWAARPAPAASAPGELQMAALVGLGVVGLHGLMDDALYSSPGVLLLFVLTGLVVALTRIERARPGLAGRTSAQRRPTLATWGWLVAGLVVVLVAVVQGKTGLAAAYANGGAVQMARIELADWPTGEWATDPPAPELTAAEGLFQQALRLDPRNRTAHHRLGLLAAQAGDYPSAIEHLRQALAVDDAHRGIRKVLGYVYVWAGQPDEALPLLAGLPEAAHEMSVYAGWWQQQGQVERSLRAAEMASQLAEGEAGQP